MSSFSEQLAAYKSQIDADVAVYAAHVRKVTKQHYGEDASIVTETFLDMLERGGKRIRGALVMAGYEMCGGTDRQMIVRAATAIEMIHTHLLIIDDIQDRSKLRRGKPTAHEMLTTYHQKNKLRGDAAHTGVSLALNAAFGGNAAAHMLLAGLNVDPLLKTNVLGIVNLTITTTAHGQTQDIINEVHTEVTTQDVERTMEWKTANYTVLNPLCVGMVLAGAGCEDTDAIRAYAIAAGMAFQITDDILGIFGTDEQTGKSTMDDLREGKQTLLTVYALRHARPVDQAFLRSCLGNRRLTQDDLVRCQHIIQDSGARQYAEEQAIQYSNRALTALEHESHRWSPATVVFLKELAAYLKNRVS